MPDLEPHDGCSTNTAVMPTEMDVDAAEPMAGGNVGFSRNDSYVESSLTSSSPDIDEHCDVNTVDPVLDSTNNHDTGTHYHCVAMETEDPFTEAHSCLTDTDREHIDKQMAKVSFPSNPTNTSGTYPGKSSLGKGKDVDPRNWGGISLDNPEMDPQIQQDMLMEFNARCDIDPQPSTCNLEPNTLTADIGYITGGDMQCNEEMNGEDALHEVSYKDVLEYLHNKKELECEMDRLWKKEKTSHRKHKEHADSELLSNKLTALIQKVTKGSKRKQKYKSDMRKKTSKSDVATKPITQITSKSALGHAFERLGK
ncbi:hypothetical protein C0995_005789 [Termitomyces sp. Mi166|nr:hypothetical protein C0995_005789 [Termitomyces sp. Mi166\